MAKVKVVTGPKGTVMKVKQDKKQEVYKVATSTKGMSTKDTIKYSPKVREQAQKNKKPKKKTK